MNLNGMTPVVDAVALHLRDVRKDWKAEAAEIRLDLTRGLLELERLKAELKARLAELADGPPGPPGRNGEDADPALIERMVSEAVARIPAPKDGAPGVFTAPKPFKAGAITYRGELVYCEGSTYCALVDTAATPPHADFQPVAFRGRDAYAGEACGLYDPARKYRALDVVALNGSEWRARKDDPGALPGDDWMLTARAGSRGQKGEDGAPGPAGPPGRPGVGVEAWRIRGYSILIELTSGAELELDLAPMFQIFADELEAQR